MREVGSIGTGNAATALSSLLKVEVKMTVPSIGFPFFGTGLNSVAPTDSILFVFANVNTAGRPVSCSFRAYTYALKMVQTTDEIEQTINGLRS